MKRRGQIKNRVLPLRHEGRLNAGAEVLVGERKIGEVLSGGDSVSLGLMRLDRLDGGATCDGAPVAVAIPHWLKDLIPERSDG